MFRQTTLAIVLSITPVVTLAGAVEGAAGQVLLPEALSAGEMKSVTGKSGMSRIGYSRYYFDSALRRATFELDSTVKLGTGLLDNQVGNWNLGLQASIDRLSLTAGAGLNEVTDTVDQSVDWLNAELDEFTSGNDFTMNRLSEGIDWNLKRGLSMLTAGASGLTDRLDWGVNIEVSMIDRGAGALIAPLEMGLVSQVSELDAGISGFTGKLDTSVGNHTQSLGSGLGSGSAELDSGVGVLTSGVNGHASTIGSGLQSLGGQFNFGTSNVNSSW